MSTKRFLNPEQIAAWQPMHNRPCTSDPTERLRQSLKNHNLWMPSQVAGRNFAMGCVSLEVTQRCNLDCSLCYLSDMAEAVHDLPLSEVFRRVDMIADQFGSGTNVQISGGDPTLRTTAVVREASELAVLLQ
ncbi:MAG: radical SAM protein, partial [Pseudomonadota bacterium]